MKNLLEKKGKILITGVSGLLGSNLALFFRNSYDVLGTYCTQPVVIEGIATQGVDIRSKKSVHNLIEQFKPNVVIHCAAIADVEFCETHKELAGKVNILGTKILVECLQNHNSKLIHISTDLVYDGVKGNYSEGDPVSPNNYYGYTKCKSEEEALKNKKAFVARTNFFGINIIPHKLSLAEWILSELSHHRKIKGFTDVFFCSLHTPKLASILDAVIKKDLHGIFNCASSSFLAKYEFAVELAERFGLDPTLIEPISVDDFPFKAKRSKNLTLKIDKLYGMINTAIPSFEESIDSFYEETDQRPVLSRKSPAPNNHMTLKRE